MKKDGPSHVLVYASTVAVVCAFLLSAVRMVTAPYREANERAGARWLAED